MRGKSQVHRHHGDSFGSAANRSTGAIPGGCDSVFSIPQKKKKKWKAANALFQQPISDTERAALMSPTFGSYPNFQVRAARTVEGLTPNFICYPLHPNAIARMNQRGGNALGTDHMDRSSVSRRRMCGTPCTNALSVILLSTGWATADGDSPVGTMTTNTTDRLKAVVQDRVVYSPSMYVGYARSGQDEKFSPGMQESISSA